MAITITRFQMHIVMTRCDEENNGCDDFNTLHFMNICKRITDNNPITYEFFSKITPKLLCPVKPVILMLNFFVSSVLFFFFCTKIFIINLCLVASAQDVYDLSAGIIDIGMVSRMPVSGFIWGVHMRIRQIHTNALVFCANLDAKFMRFNERTRKRM